MTYQEALKQVEKASKMIVEANSMVADSITSAFIYRWNWYVACAMIIVPWIVWAIFRKKDSSARLICAGFFVMIFSAVLDTLGIEFGLWAYPVKVIPSPTLSFSYRLSMLPVLAMFFIQIKPNVSPYLKAILYGAISAYVGLPLLSMVDLYKKINWAYTYSFFILTTMYLIANWLTQLDSFNRIEHTNERSQVSFDLPFFRKKQRNT